MAWYPLAKKRVIAPGPNDPPVQIIGAILHVDAGNSGDLYEYFKNDSGGVESHFHIPKVGQVQQYRDTHYEADANLKGNSFIASNGARYGYASIETQGLEKGEWNAHQLANIKALLKWLSETHNFPLRRCKSPTSPGVGYHIMFGAPGAWTPVSKSCPGPDRVRQYEHVLVPWFEAGAPSGPAAPSPSNEELDMDENTLRAILADELNKQDLDLWVNTRGTGKKLVIDRLTRIEGIVADLQKKVTAPTTPEVKK